ncbi:MAG: sigma-70 family RNA polymerase sigma factor [Solobacterium sp.]|nr:sigma-70 family RNA polymerase sigma factor [Solobacterium sp.]
MEDAAIVELYWDRNEDALKETDVKYGRYCRSVAWNILHDREDTKECVNDTYLQTWNSIPPNRPENLRTYLGRICRNAALTLYEKIHALKRGGQQTASCLDELAEIVGRDSDVQENLDAGYLTDAINRFLRDTEKEVRMIFVRRYWYMSSVREIAHDLGISESKVKMTLFRTREKLKEYLREEGFAV